ncbi:MAG TPA: ATP-binding protein [Gemmatimonadaceae bacterium]
MTTVIKVPPTLDEHTFEQVLEQVAVVPQDGKMLLDARHTKWASPYGLTAMLTLGQARKTRATFAAPENDETLSYWSRSNFFYYAADLFELTGVVPKRAASGESPVLLPITPVAGSEDVHQVVGHIQERAQQIIATELKLDPKAIVGFAMTLSEVCQNIIEHAGPGGWVMVQTYDWKKRLGRRVVVIAVCDAGSGFRKSLESASHRPLPDRWDDAAALESAVMRGVSRFRDPGRGQGLAGVRKYIGRWDGKLWVRSGTARIAIVPGWDDDAPLLEQLPYFPGAQIQVTIPERAKR